jgi:hypothetical protein
LRILETLETATGAKALAIMAAGGRAR